MADSNLCELKYLSEHAQHFLCVLVSCSIGVLDTRDLGQPACHEEPKKWKSELVMWIKDVTACSNVMYIGLNDVECVIRISTCTLLKKFWREKTLGEMWAAVIRTINNLLRTAWLRTRAPDWGQSRSQLMLRRGPWWSYSRGASRRK